MSVDSTEARLEAQDGRATLSGAVDFATVAGLWKESDRLFEAASSKSIEVSLQQVGAADSAGLALLVGWLARAREEGVQLAYVDVPDRIRALAQISEVEPMFTESRRG
jgi:phospholipid transport system transporter-binding protein